MKLSSVLKLIIALFFLSIPSAPIHALTPDEVFDKVKDSVVVVNTLDAQGKVKGQGSGVLLPSGKIATNCHVVDGGASYQVGRGKELAPATLFAEDWDKDICILDAESITGKPAQLGKATSLKVGKPVYAVGAPQGLELSLSDGIVSQLRGRPSPLIQTTAAISPGSSGGGLFDAEGRLVGLTTLCIEGGQNLNFALPVEWISEVKPGRTTVAKGRGQIDWLKRAAALLTVKDWQGLVEWCQKWTKTEPANTLAWNYLGIAYHELKRYGDAIEAYRQAIRIDPEYASAWHSLGYIYLDLKRYGDAIEAYRQAIRIDPEWSLVGLLWNELGDAYMKLKRYGDAVETYRQVIRIDPEDAVAWHHLGTAYHELKRYDDAVEAYRQAVRIEPKEAAFWYNLGKLYLKLQKYGDALPAFRQALSINPEIDVAWLDLGITCSMVKRHNDAIDAYRQALRINPQLAVAWNNLAIEYAALGNRTAAMNAIRELRRLDPEKAEKLRNSIGPR